MKIEFDSTLDYQREAIRSVIDLWKGNTESQIFHTQESSLLKSVGNNLNLSQEDVLKNLQKVQTRQGLELSQDLEKGLHFCIEMETGTGKTYVYLRTIYELNQQHGFKKFVIIVPSLAIKEGVIKTLKITKEHFNNIYENPLVNFKVYDGNRISILKTFSESNQVEILVINIDSFAKEENKINKSNDLVSGLKPISLIQQVKPIAIIDEPQNMETEKRKRAIDSLNTLFTLRYSATHKFIYNLVYRLDPVKAYDLGLVKQISISSILEEDNNNEAFISLNGISPAKVLNKFKAQVTILTKAKIGLKRKTFTIKIDDDLYELSGGLEVYKNGYIFTGIDLREAKKIFFKNGVEVIQGNSKGISDEEIIKEQIRQTIKEHLEKELKVNSKGIKVLSLFFLDQVSNYRIYLEDGKFKEGKVFLWFEEIYQELIRKPKYQSLNQFPLKKIHNGYFSQDKKGILRDTKGNTQLDDDTYALIMRDKEALLSLDNPLRFIFSHSALREGWDNPNVFQICTLNQSKSEMKKRQEIGRGLRLCVNQEGKRIYDKEVNQLTLIVNESYEDFAYDLQTEIKEECGISFEGRIKNSKNKRKVTYRRNFKEDPLFIELWNKIAPKTYFRIFLDSQELIQELVKSLQEMPKILKPSISRSKAYLDITKKGIETSFESSFKVDVTKDKSYLIPNLLKALEEKTKLTRDTLYRVLLDSLRLEEVFNNPQMFLEQVSKRMENILSRFIIEGIQYKKCRDERYNVNSFRDDELESYSSYYFQPKNYFKTISNNYIPLDSNTEKRFAEDCESSAQVAFYMKLPSWFKIPTPVGNYNPDWALVFEDSDKNLHVIVETKNTGGKEVILEDLRDKERMKIQCAIQHFKVLDKVEYQVATNLSDLSKKIYNHSQRDD